MLFRVLSLPEWIMFPFCFIEKNAYVLSIWVLIFINFQRCVCTKRWDFNRTILRAIRNYLFTSRDLSFCPKNINFFCRLQNQVLVTEKPLWALGSHLWAFCRPLKFYVNDFQGNFIQPWRTINLKVASWLLTVPVYLKVKLLYDKCAIFSKLKKIKIIQVNSIH